MNKMKKEEILEMAKSLKQGYETFDEVVEALADCTSLEDARNEYCLAIESNYPDRRSLSQWCLDHCDEVGGLSEEASFDFGPFESFDSMVSAMIRVRHEALFEEVWKTALAVCLLQAAAGLKDLEIEPALLAEVIEEYINNNTVEIEETNALPQIEEVLASKS